MRAAIRPAVLLKDTHNVLRVGRIDRDLGLNLSIQEVGARLVSVRTTGVGAWTGDSDKCCLGRVGVCQGSTGSSQGRQDNQKYREGCYDPDMLQVTHEILLLVNSVPK